MKRRINFFFLILALVLGLSACSINLPGFSDSFKAEIQGNQLIVAKNYSLPAGMVINGDIVAIGASITLESGSLIKGNVLLFGSSLENNGIIKGDLNLFAGSAFLRNSSILTGDVNQLFNHVVIEKNAQITGEINTISFPSAPAERISGIVTVIGDRLNPQNWLVWDIVRIIASSLLALLAGIILKKRLPIMSHQIQTQPILSWGAGLLILMVIPILSILLIITICFSPLGLLLLAALAILYLAGWIVIGITSGAVLQSWFRAQWPFELQAFLGALIFGIATTLVSKLPYLSLLLNILLGCAGLGAIVITRFGTSIENNANDLQPKKDV